MKIETQVAHASERMRKWGGIVEECESRWQILFVFAWVELGLNVLLRDPWYIQPVLQYVKFTSQFRFSSVDGKCKLQKLQFHSSFFISFNSWSPHFFNTAHQNSSSGWITYTGKWPFERNPTPKAKLLSCKLVVLIPYFSSFWHLAM